MTTASTPIGIVRFYTVLFGIFAAAILAVPSYSVVSGSLSANAKQDVSVNTFKAPIHENNKSVMFSSWLPMSMAPAPLVETIEIFGSDCATPKTTFRPGETVCAKTDGVSLSPAGNYYVNWTGPNGTVDGATITQNPQTFLFSLPTSAGDFGLWKANIGRVSPAESSIIGDPPLFNLVSGTGLATFAADCSTPKDSFNLGETICARVVDAPVNLVRIEFVDPAGFVRDSVNVTTGTQLRSFTLPTDPTPGLSGDVFVDNRGTWRVNITETTDATVMNAARVTVSDPAVSVCDLQVSKTYEGGSTGVAGGTLKAVVWAYNYGPDASQNVTITDETPANTTFQSLVQTDGPAFNCTTPTVGGSGVTTCTRSSLARGEVAGFVITYEINSNTGNTTTTSTATASSTTDERTSNDNDSSADATVSNPTPSSCTLTCPSNITVGSSSVNSSGQAGAIVTFANATTSGTCGTLTSTPASGSFFAVGSSVVTQETSTGQECSFIVTVVDDDAPTISCPANITVNETSAGAGAAVNYTGLTASDNSGTPTITCQEGTDNRPSGSTFAVGTHTISCTATDEDNNTSAACTFDITVNAAPACVLTPPANVSVNSPANACAATVTYDSPTADSNCASGTTISCDHPSGSSFPVGTTVVTCTSSPDGATTSFTVTVNDVTGPVPDVATLPTVTGECTATAGIPTTVVVLDQFGNPIGTQIVSELPRATDSCDGSTAGATNDQRTYDEPGTYTVNWTYTDASGNTSTQQQTVIVTGASGGLNITGAPVVGIHNAAGSTACVMVIDDLSSILNTSVSGFCGTPEITRTITPAPGDGNDFTVGTVYTVVSTVTEGSNTDSVTQTFKIIDDTPPVVVTVPADATYECASQVPAGNPSQATATDNCVAPTVTVADTNNGGAGSLSNPLIITRTFTATDVTSGLTHSKAQTITVKDTTAPTISCPANITVYLPLNSTDTSTVVNYTAPVGSDNCGTANTAQTAGLASGASFPVGTTTNTFVVTDGVGQTAECSFTVTVLYNFTGFFSPVSNPPTVNNVNAGRAVPLKFSLSGNKGLSIFAAGYPSSQQVACDSSAPLSDLEGTETSGGSTLTYSPDQYHYSWKTESSWANTCRVLVVKLNDGTEHIAIFKFK